MVQEKLMSLNSIATRRVFCAGLAALSFGLRPSLAGPKPQKDMNIRGQYLGIIDVYQDNDPFDLDIAWELGVRAIIHGATYTHRGCHADNKYIARKAKALSMGFLWGAYCMMTAEDVHLQLERFLNTEDGSNQNILMALDWEPNHCGPASYDQIRQAVSAFRDRLGFYPIIYGSPYFSLHQIKEGDALLAKCPLWYANYSGNDTPKSPPPAATWKDYTLWQFDDEHRNNGAPYPATVLAGADWSKFKGSFDQLREAWPFRHT
jgi:lysozyme